MTFDIKHMPQIWECDNYNTFTKTMQIYALLSRQQYKRKQDNANICATNSLLTII